MGVIRLLFGLNSGINKGAMKKIFLLSTLYFLLPTFLIGCAGRSVVSTPRLKQTVRIGSSRYITAQSLSEAYNLDYYWDAITKKVTLSKGEKAARMMAGSRLALLNDSVRTMDKEARFYQGSLAIPESFTRRSLSPFFREKHIRKKIIPPTSGLPIKKVIIDAGHGGKDPGAVGRRGLKEKDVVLDIAKRLKKKLEARGIDVILTRESDRFISLSQRSRIANANAGDVDFFISIHANASRSSWVNGVEVFYLSESIDDDLRAFRAAKNYKLNLKEGCSGKYTKVILWDLIYRNNRKASIRLASYVCKSLSKNIRQRNRGIKPARFYVLKGTNIPAILAEVGFISNAREEKKLRDASYRNKIAQALADGIIQYNRDFTQRRYTRH